MADLVTSQILLSGRRHLVMRFTNVSDATGETGVVKVNATTANGIVVQGQTIFPGVHLKVVKCQYDVAGMGLRIQWVATTNEDILVLNGYGTFDMTDIGGIANPGTAALPGSTGSIAFTTIAAAANASYTIVLAMTLGIPQS